MLGFGKHKIRLQGLSMRAVERGTRQGYRKGFDQGRKEAQIEGERIARRELEKRREEFQQHVNKAAEDAEQLAYIAVVRALGNPDIPSLEEARRMGTVDRIVTHSNVYQMTPGTRDLHQATGFYEVRVLKDGQRLVHRESYKADTMVAALAHAITWRNQAVGDDHHFEELFDDIMRDHMIARDYMRGPLAISEARALAIQFHRQMLAQGIALEDSGFVGDDPAEHFQLPDRTLLGRSWERLQFPQRAKDTFRKQGFNQARTVRDLLLVTAEDCRMVRGCGRETLRSIRAVLSQHGLALWGDEPPAPVLVPGEALHRGRGIDLH